MVKSRLCETARLAFFSARPSFSLFKMRDREIWDFWALRKKSRLQDLKSAEKTRLRDPWNSAKILRDPDFLKEHSPPLIELFIGNCCDWALWGYNKHPVQAQRGRHCQCPSRTFRSIHYYYRKSRRAWFFLCLVSYTPTHSILLAIPTCLDFVWNQNSYHLR